ncbi:MAG: beta-carotene 15,15'-monooxygenase [Cytophagales bacterium CG18_big_fil_WC_8_21_14_2_50_42_9]|nr:MAG: beta-carotene 15,15'-monooxygenase [Cytophagales bacterium CG18_big_fil_WC_8_21_14_2_50_42_9]
MTDILRITLPVYFTLFFAFAFVLKSIIVAKRIGKNPIVLPQDDSAYGLIGFYFKLTLLALFVYVLAFAFFPNWHNSFLAIQPIDSLPFKYLGLGLLVFALIWTIIGQHDMRNSWRIGIDAETKTELVTTGLFRISRNPIFFGMTLSLMGLFLTNPNALTGLFLILGYVLIQIQIRLEEDYLTKQHGLNYLSYKQKVRRFI